MSGYKVLQSLQSCFVTRGMSSRNKVHIQLGREWSADVLKIQRFGLTALGQINCVAHEKQFQRYSEVLNFFLMH